VFEDVRYLTIAWYCNLPWISGIVSLYHCKRKEGKLSDPDSQGFSKGYRVLPAEVLGCPLFLLHATCGGVQEKKGFGGDIPHPPRQKAGRPLQSCFEGLRMNKRNQKTMLSCAMQSSETKARIMLNNNLFLLEKRPSTQTILVVEDDFAIGGLLVDVINEETPYKAFLTSSGEQALQFVRSLKPDLFLLDYQLPCMNGLELYDTLHAMKGFVAIPALFMSANAPVSELEKRHVSFISKPFELEEMLNTIDVLLSKERVLC
jgi:CheY-like chemotaxis protein